MHFLYLELSKYNNMVRGVLNIGSVQEVQLSLSTPFAIVHSVIVESKEGENLFDPQNIRHFQYIQYDICLLTPMIFPSSFCAKFTL